jgi:hypothetical protein
VQNAPLGFLPVMHEGGWVYRAGSGPMVDYAEYFRLIAPQEFWPEWVTSASHEEVVRALRVERAKQAATKHYPLKSGSTA